MKRNLIFTLFCLVLASAVGAELPATNPFKDRPSTLKWHPYPSAVLSEGKVLSTYTNTKGSIHKLVVRVDRTIYFCEVSTRTLSCWMPQDKVEK
jgi:hypothetical protein